MRFKFLLGICFSCFGTAGWSQDSSAVNKQTQLITRFESITGKEPDLRDSLLILKGELAESAVIIERQNNTIHDLRSEITALEKDYLLGKYGHPGFFTPYGDNQVNDFKKNGYLAKYNTTYPGLHIYFAFDETNVDLNLYKESLTALANELKTDPSKRLIIEGYSDTWGKSEANLQYARERANVVKEYLIQSCGVPASLLVVNYYGSIGENRYKEPEMDFLNRQVLLILK